ncbi:MAG TPA: hypothetical protein VGI39_40800, partial [Polyangiaceae bacterium]
MRLPRPSLSTLFFVALAVLATAPAWIVRYPPLEDMPCHVAAMRVIHSLHDPAFGLEPHFQLTFGNTQYVFYYVLGSFLTYFIGITAANVALVCIYLGGTPLAVRDLCRAIGKDERLAIFVVPMLVNVMFEFGLLPFMFAVPIMFWALAAAVRWFDELGGARRPEVLRRHGIVVGVVTFILFYSHIFPFALFGIGYAMFFPWRRPRDWVRAALPVIPTLLVVVWWFFFTAPGKIAQGAIDSKDAIAPLDQAIHNVNQWTLDIFKDTTDEAWTLGLLFSIVLAWGLAQGDRDSTRWEARALVVLPLFCFVLYFTTGESRGPVWLFAQRFPILFLMTMVPLLRFPRGARGVLATGVALFVAVGSIVNVCKHYVRFQLEEVGDIDGAIDQIPAGQKVAALIFDKHSNIVNWAPFLHFGSFYQASKGGVLEFTYAGYKHWPFTFKSGKFPPQPDLPPDSAARLRWEWTPESIPVRGELYPYYDYILARGAGFRPPPG